jgi:hypothetical protein
MSHAFSKTTSDKASGPSRCPRSAMKYAFAISPIFEGRMRLSTLATRISRFASPNPSCALLGMSCWSRQEVKSVSGTTMARETIIQRLSLVAKTLPSLANCPCLFSLQTMKARMPRLTASEMIFVFMQGRRGCAEPEFWSTKYTKGDEKWGRKAA